AGTTFTLMVSVATHRKVLVTRSQILSEVNTEMLSVVSPVLHFISPADGSKFFNVTTLPSHKTVSLEPISTLGTKGLSTTSMVSDTIHLLASVALAIYT